MAVNRGGTLELIKLAANAGNGTPVVHVSTNGIFPLGSSEQFAEDCDTSGLVNQLDAHDGYGLTKWAAERLVTQASIRA